MNLIINIIFIGLTVIVFLISLSLLWGNRRDYLHSILNKTSHFSELKNAENIPLDTLDDGCKALALDMCAVKQKKKRSYISFRDGRVELLRHPTQVIEDFSIASFKSVPAILTTLGILGTFVGITIGLNGLSDFGSDSSALVEQASTLIGGLGTAFITSIAGMGLSFIFMLFFSWSVSKTKNAKDGLADYIQKESVVVTSNDLLHQLVIGQQVKDEQVIDLDKLVRTLDTLAGKPDAITANEFESLSNISVDKICNKIASMEKSINDKLTENKLDEIQLGTSITSSMSGILDKAFQIPNELLNDICQESKQINQATYSLSGMLESLTSSNHESVSLAEIEAIIDQKISNPISEQTTKVTNSLLGINLKLADITEKAIKEDSLSLLLTNQVAAPISKHLESLHQTSESIFSHIEPLPKLISQQSHTINIFAQQMSQVTSLVTSMADNMISEQVINLALSTHVAEPLNQISLDVKQNAIEQLNASNRTVHAIDELANARTDEFESLIVKMGEEIVEPITTELANTNTVVAKFADISNQLNQSVTQTVEEMAKATAVVANFEQNTLEKLNVFASSMDTSLNNFAINSTAALKDITNEVQGIVELGSKSIQEQTDAFSQMICESDAIFKQQSKTLKDVGIESAALMSTAKQELESGLGDIDAKVLNMSVTVQSELERFREQYQQNLTLYFTEQNSLLESSLNAQKEGLNEVVGNFKSVFEQEYTKRSEMLDDLNIHHKQMIDVIERVQVMAKALGLENASWVDTVQLQSQLVSRQMADLGLSFAKASEDFKILSSQMRPEMDDYFKRANKSVEQYFGDFDATSSRIYTRLDRAVDVMITVIEEAKHERDELAILKQKAS
ncbi:MULTISPECIES: MotA/TolQ/ExbB proton channel family protein [unclassified Shewanella]|uniref:MotA/TolQ/ExbB proton channel family protein n=1 Tax=unclassified Shewanella TaxID=196818 RepID=UPI003551CE44